MSTLLLSNLNLKHRYNIDELSIDNLVNLNVFRIK